MRPPANAGGAPRSRRGRNTAFRLIRHFDDYGWRRATG